MAVDEIIDEDTFDARFKPIESPGQQCGSHLWEHHEVRDAVTAGTITEQQVWTYVDDGEGGYGILPGFHMVNKIEYMVTEVPADENVTVEIPEEPDEEPEEEETPTAQMPYKQALDMAIFAINTLMHPDASTDEDVARLESHAAEIVETLVDIRSTVTGLP